MDKGLKKVVRKVKKILEKAVKIDPAMFSITDRPFGRPPYSLTRKPE